MSMSDEHVLSAVPNEVIGRAIKDPDFRRGVLERRESHKDVNAYLEVQGFAALEDDAFAAISALNPDAVEAVLAGLQLRPEINQIAAA